MRIPPQVSERLKEAPAQALRAVFAGIGQVLLVADRIRARVAQPEPARPSGAERQGQPPAAQHQAQATEAQRQGQQARPGRPAPSDAGRWRSLDETGNVRLLAEDEAGEQAGPTAAAAPAETPAAPPEPEATEPEATEPEATEPATPAVALPVPNYDELSVPSLRARLRNLDSAQVRVLLEYEKANAGRDAVLTMFQRRIAKLEGGEN